MANVEKLYIETPSLYSFPLSKVTGFDVYLKLDNLQPPGSFKFRGMSNFILKAAKGGTCNHVICASGGNAGLAAAYTSKQLGIQCTIVLPSTTPGFVADKLRFLNSFSQFCTCEIFLLQIIRRKNSIGIACKILSPSPGNLYAPAFDHPDLWEGHASLIEEASRQLPCKPDVIVTCVGGGGLLNGVVEGMRKVGWQDVPVVVLETHGADCFNASIRAGEVVTLPAITSIAKSLGSLVMSETTYKYYKEASPEIISQVISDKMAVNACVKLAEDHRILVEPACGASLAALYSGIITQLQEENKLGKVKTVLVEVCGGANVTTALLEQWKADFDI